MHVGFIILLVVAVIVYAGLAHRALDRLRLSDRGALLFLAAMLLGGFLPDIPLGGNISINVGGGLIPLLLVGYLFSKAESWETGRTIIALVITTAVVYAAMKILPVEPTGHIFVDPLYLIAIIAGLTAYLVGRSRRGAFIAGVMAIVLSDLLAYIENTLIGVRASMVIGGAGFFDAVVIAGFIALGLAEVFGETAERFAPLLRGNAEGKTEYDQQGEGREERGEAGEGQGDG